MNNSIEYLKSIDRETKPAHADDEWLLQGQLYDDRSRDDTIRRLHALGVGIKDNQRPLEIALLRRVVDRLAVVYDSPPTRWLVGGLERLTEESTDHVTMDRVLKRAQYDLAWKRIDRVRALHRQAIVRFYPSDTRGSVTLRVFEPFNVIREVDPSAADEIESDHQFALCLAKSGSKELWEHWTREGSVWRMHRTDQRGSIVSAPYAGSDGVNPYGELPVQIIYDELPQGRPWLSPRASRSAWSIAINAIANDLWSLVTHQAHSRIVTYTDDPSGVPSQTGHGGVSNFDRNDRFEIHTPNPKIGECGEVLKMFFRFASLVEDLPISEFDESKQVVTGAALQVQERALLARRESLVPLAWEDERAAFSKLRAVHNLHTQGLPGSKWTLPTLSEGLELEVEIADVAEPIDSAQLQDALFRDIAIGAASVIDYIQKRDGVSRASAVKTYHRVRLDSENFPAQTIVPHEGPKPAASEDPRENTAIAHEAEGQGFAERAKVASVVDAIDRVSRAS